MKRIGLTFALVAALALPATAAGHRQDRQHNAVKRCKELRDDQAQSSRRGGKLHRGNARRRCVSKRVNPRRRLHNRLKREAFADAVSECRAERAEDPEAFEQTYGTVETAQDGDEPVRSRPFARCVRLKLKEALAALRETFQNAAEDCKAERSEDADAFLERYGTNRNRRNALGKCVSEHVQAGDETEPGSEDGQEGTDDGPGETEDGPAGDEDEPAQEEDGPERPGNGPK